MKIRYLKGRGTEDGMLNKEDEKIIRELIIKLSNKKKEIYMFTTLKRGKKTYCLTEELSWMNIYSVNIYGDREMKNYRIRLV